MVGYAYAASCQCDNKMLNLDSSHPDYVDFTTNPYNTNGDFTIEFWFYSIAFANNPTCDKKTILSIDGTGSNLSIYDCNGDLYIDITGTGCTDSQLLISSIRNNMSYVIFKNEVILFRSK